MRARDYEGEYRQQQRRRAAELALVCVGVVALNLLVWGAVALAIRWAVRAWL